jgi:hypothetical protein
VLKRYPVFPLLIAAYPVLALGAYNIFEISVGDIWRPLVVSLALAGAILGVTRLILGDWHRAAMATAILLLLFFSYGQVYSELKSVSLGGIFPFRHRSLGSVWGLMLIVALVWAWRWLKNPASWTPWLNLIAALLLVYPAYTILAAGVGRRLDSARHAGASEGAPANSGSPDIYYIILDGYARQDLLRAKYGYDNSEFINGLEERGFYVANCSQSNYARTLTSLASSLNMEYTDDLPIDPQVGAFPFLKYGTVRAFLEQRGYKTAAFPTGFQWTEWTDADFWYEAGLSAGGLTEFETLFAQTTLLRIPFDLMDYQITSAFRLEDNRRLRTFNALTALETFPDEDGNLFVFAHIVIPHPPYYFGPNGEDVLYTAGKLSDPEERRAYADQARFISHEILRVIDTILAKSDRPPIIILQGDHGPPIRLGTPGERMRNLNAYYLPGLDPADVLYPSITPVNTFRVILNEYFGQNLRLLADRSYFSPSDSDDIVELPIVCPEE